MIVADSDVLIDALRGRDPWRARIALELRSGNLATTVITVFELLSGARTARETEKVEQLLAGLRLLPLDDAAARESAAIRRELDAEGMAIATADTLIAGICRAADAILLTRNRSHFDRVEGLRLGSL